MNPSYDTEAATELLGKALVTDDAARHLEERKKQAGELIKAALGAAAKAGFSVDLAKNEVFLPGRFRAVLAYDERTVVISRTLGGPPRTDFPDVEYNPSRGCFEGKREDTFRSPTPGQRRPRQDATAAIAEKLIELLNNRA